jgi:glycosyltransferase involved in cell wall biosynthesis
MMRSGVIAKPSKCLLTLVLPPRWRRKIREQLLSLSVSQLYGPETIPLSSHEAIVTCVVKNGEYYIEHFIEHYTQMGFRHIFFLDNRSTDQTTSIAKKYKNVSVCRTNLSIEGNQGLFKRYLAGKSSTGGWCLDADIDELFDYPGSEVLELQDFLEYLNDNRYTAVVTQLLDMFSDQPLSHLVKKQQVENLKKTYQYYDISEVERMEYCHADVVRKNAYRNEISNENTELLFGGIRRTLYGSDWLTNCLLTKHSLFCTGQGVELFPHVHFVNNAKLADVSCPMLHYKLTSNALDTALQNKQSFPTIGKGYGDFIDFLLKNPDYHIRRSTAVKYEGASVLADRRFLFESDRYREYVASFHKRLALNEAGD